MVYTSISKTTWDPAEAQIVSVIDTDVDRRCPVVSVPCPAWANPLFLTDLARDLYLSRKER